MGNKSPSLGSSQQGGIKDGRAETPAPSPSTSLLILFCTTCVALARFHRTYMWVLCVARVFSMEMPRHHALTVLHVGMAPWSAASAGRLHCIDGSVSLITTHTQGVRTAPKKAIILQNKSRPCLLTSSPPVCLLGLVAPQTFVVFSPTTPKG